MNKTECMGMDTLLSFEKQLLLDTFDDDFLILVARGLGIDRLFLNYLKLYADPKLLILVLNTSSHDEAFFITQLKRLQVDPLPIQITSEINSNDRQKLYEKGGILFVTSRILIVDMLTEKLPTHLVNGIMVYKAHKLLDSFQESFILRLYRQKKSNGFVKAFSDHPTALAYGGMGQLQKLVSRLYVRKVELVPRFHINVKKCLEENAPEVIEMRFKLTPSMKTIRSALCELIIACLKELAQANPSHINKDKDLEKVGLSSVEDKSISKTVHETELERNLAAECACLTHKTEQLLVDLKYLRALLVKLEAADAVTFLKAVKMMKDDQKNVTLNVGWIFTSSAAKLFTEAEERLDVKSADRHADLDCSSSVVVEDVQYEDYAVEVAPKLRAVTAVMKEIMETVEETTQPKHNRFGRTLIVTSSDSSAQQVYDLISHGLPKYCANIATRAQTLKFHEKRKNVEESCSSPLWDPLQLRLKCEKMEPMPRGPKITLNPGRAGRGKRGKDLQPGQTTLTELVDRSAKKSKIELQPEIIEGETINRECVIVPMHDRHGLLVTIHDLQPTFVVLYQSHLAALREVEMYAALQTHYPVRLYMLMYEDSTEEQAYLTALHKEKAAFEFLIQESGSLLNRREYDVIRAAPPSIKPETSTRKAGGQASSEDGPTYPKVVVDMRELRSELPLLLYKRGIDVLPVTLEVGDYVLTPEIVVERKSHTDLVQSLQSGRLYTQVQNMMQHYKRVILLIEGGTGSSKRLGAGPFTGDLGPASRELRSKLTILTRQCPQLRLVWTNDPTVSAELFEELKFNQPEPNVDEALKVKVDEVTHGNIAKPTCKEMLLSLPGINEKYANLLMQQPQLAFRDVCKMNPEDLQTILNLNEKQGKKICENVVQFLNKQFNPEQTKKYTNVKLL